MRTNQDIQKKEKLIQIRKESEYENMKVNNVLTANGGALLLVSVIGYTNAFSVVTPQRYGSFQQYQQQPSIFSALKASVAESTDSVGASADDNEQGGPKNGKKYSRKKKFKDNYGLNEAINKLAEQASDARQPVIRRAMAAEDLWKEFLVSPDETGEATSNLQSDTVSFNTVLKAWGKAAQVLAERHNDRNHDHLLDPNIPIYTARECAAHAQELLDKHEQAFRQSVQDEDSDGTEKESLNSLDSNSYNTVMDAWAKSGTDEAIDRVEDLLRRLQKSSTVSPDVRSYNALVDAYAHSNLEDRLDKLNRIWDHMEENPDLQPCSRTMNSILHAYSLMIQERPNDRAELAKQASDKFDSLKKRYLETGLPDYEPDVMSYTTIMDVWGRVGTMEAVRKVESLFQELRDLESSSNSNLRPNSYSYTVLITAWSRVAWADQAGNRVKEILEAMIDDKTVKLNCRPFTAALRCWSRGRSNEKAVLALNTLKQMKQIAKEEPAVNPNLQTYHAALECCGRTVDADLSQYTVALKISFAILQSMTKDGIEANSMTYSKLLKCVETLLPAGEERNKVALAAFEKARTAGMADALVIKSFQKAADIQVVLKAISEVSDKNGYVDYKRIPQSWKKNAN